MTVKSHIEDDNQLIFSGQISRNKSKTSKSKFATISSLQSLFLQDGDHGSWLNATLYAKRIILTWSDCETF